MNSQASRHPTAPPKSNCQLSVFDPIGTFMRPGAAARARIKQASDSRLQRARQSFPGVPAVSHRPLSKPSFSANDPRRCTWPETHEPPAMFAALFLRPSFQTAQWGKPGDVTARPLASPRSASSPARIRSEVLREREPRFPGSVSGRLISASRRYEPSGELHATSLRTPFGGTPGVSLPSSRGCPSPWRRL